MTAFLTRTIDGGHAAVQRLLGVLWRIAEASVAAGVAWYVAHDVLGHPDPFFAPIAAAVFVSASNVFQAQRAIQNIVGVALGICLGATVQQLFGTEWIAMAAMVFVALCVAVLLGQGILGRDLTFANQTAGSAILVMALSVGTDSVFQRLQEALIGGGVALAQSETDPGRASARVTATREQVAALDSAGATRTNLALTTVVETCANDLQRVIDLRQ
jgi:hypothetical protein